MKRWTFVFAVLAALLPLIALAETMDGYDLYQSYRKQYGSPMKWGQAVWAAFDSEMDAAEATDFDSRMLKSTVYPPASSAKLSMEEAAEIACRDSGVPEEDAISFVLIGAQPNPVWKFRLCSPMADVDRLVEVDAMTGEILDREAYKADNYIFDNPIKMYTLHRAYAPEAIKEYGLVYMSAVEVSKRYGDMRLDDPMLPLVDGTKDIWVQGKTVTFKALEEGDTSYRVTYGDGYMVTSVEAIE
ncbi:MAG: PepSY domain-containing protein [Clostridia bacterium]|nr:PepSY domain-containing protein [Clostridia bacterium]